MKLFILFFTLIAACQNNPKESSKETFADTPSVAATAAPAKAPSPPSSYDNEYFGWHVDLPEGWKVFADEPVNFWNEAGGRANITVDKWNAFLGIQKDGTNSTIVAYNAIFNPKLQGGGSYEDSRKIRLEKTVQNFMSSGLLVNAKPETITISGKEFLSLYVEVFKKDETTPRFYTHTFETKVYDDILLITVTGQDKAAYDTAMGILKASKFR